MAVVALGLAGLAGLVSIAGCDGSAASPGCSDPCGTVAASTADRLVVVQFGG